MAKLASPSVLCGERKRKADCAILRKVQPKTSNVHHNAQFAVFCTTLARAFAVRNPGEVFLKYNPFLVPSQIIGQLIGGGPVN